MGILDVTFIKKRLIIFWWLQYPWAVGRLMNVMASLCLWVVCSMAWRNLLLKYLLTLGFYVCSLSWKTFKYLPNPNLQQMGLQICFFCILYWAWDRIYKDVPVINRMTYEFGGWALTLGYPNAPPTTQLYCHYVDFFYPTTRVGGRR
jgi:hypothetical protein